jgi:hypothetical protein
MTFDQAVAELQSPGENGIEGYVRRATASATYYAHYVSRTDHPAPRKSVLAMSDEEFDQALASLRRRFGAKKEKAMRPTRDAIKPSTRPSGRPAASGPAARSVANLLRYWMIGSCTISAKIFAPAGSRCSVMARPRARSTPGPSTPAIVQR